MLENNQNKNLVLIEDLGMQFPTEKSKRKSRYGLFKCFCGVEFKVVSDSVKRGLTKSCGCEGGTKHGLTKHRLYDTWKGMIGRCYNKDNIYYIYYGARGITVCDEWLDVTNFINDTFPSFNEGLTLDRINNDGNYEPSNYRWVAKNIQARNTRRIRINNKTGYRGIGFHKSSNKFRARIIVNYKEIYLGLFETAIEAAEVYDKYIIDNNLEHTRNFN